MGSGSCSFLVIILWPLQHAVIMKIVFLLALAGLASCRNILPGGDQARNVELEYTYINEQGQPITVKLDSDLINLSGIREVEQREPEPVVKHVYVPAPAPKPVVHTVYVQAPAPEPEVRTVYIPAPAPKPEVRTVYVPAPAPIPVGRKIELEAPETESAEILYVKAPEPKTVKVPVHPHFVVPAPTTRTVKFERNTPVKRISSRRSFDEDDFGSAEK